MIWMVIILVFHLVIIEVFMVKLSMLMVLFVFSFNNVNVSDIDYEDILDNLDDYEYPYNHVNRNNL